jgi:apolipoprotein N-acyltransferase
MQLFRKLLNSCTAHPRLCALVLGALAACGFAPLGWWPLTLLAVAGLMALTAQAPTWQRAVLTGWLFGLGHFALGLNWIATAFTYQANMPAWLGWVAVVGLGMYLAIYPALAALGAWLIGRANYAAMVLSFAASWIVSEWLRSWVFTGFAWNPLSAAALGSFERPGLAMVLPWLGTYALSGLVVLLAGSWLIVLQRAKLDWRGAAMLILPALLMLLPDISALRQGTLRFTLIQPNVPQERLNDPANYETQFVDSAFLTQTEKQSITRLVLWPESGVPDYLREGYPRYIYQETTFAADPVLARRRIGQVIGKGSLLLTGTADLEIREGDIAGARNVVTAIDAEGKLRGSYAKAHLVPGGEYLPVRWLMEPLGLSRLVPGNIDFWPGPGPQSLQLGPWGKAGVQLCYEIVFSGQVVDRSQRPDYLFNPSNDGWFGAWGPPQHLAQARMRAIEEGLPVLRSTTNGISAVIDADGIVRSSLASNVAGRIDGLVPPAHAPTLFARFGNLLALGWVAVLLILTSVAKRRRRD